MQTAKYAKYANGSGNFGQDSQDGEVLKRLKAEILKPEIGAEAE